MVLVTRTITILVSLGEDGITMLDQPYVAVALAHC